MPKKEDADFGKWLGELKASAPELSEHLDALAQSEAGKEIFRGKVVREGDYYRRLNELAEERKALQAKQGEFESLVAQQNSWYENAKPEYERAKARAQEAEKLQKQLEEYDKKLKELGVQMTTPAVPAALPRPEDDITMRELQELRTKMVNMDQTMPLVLTQFLKVQSRALKEGFDVDPQTILQTVYQERVDPNTAYERITAEQRAARAAEERQKEIEKAREEGRREALSKLPGPDRISPAAPSIVEALRTDDVGGAILNSRTRVDAAVADFLAMQS